MKFSVAGARRAASVLPSSCRTSTPESKDTFRFARANRLTAPRELQAVIRAGKRLRTVHLDVRVIASPVSSPRIGLVVPKHQHTAVARNRLKRRLRELARAELLPALRTRSPVDISIRARPEAYTADLDALRRDIVTARRHLATDSAVVQ